MGFETIDLCLDIETYQDLEAPVLAEKLRYVKAPSNWVDKDKIKKRVEESRQKLVDKAALDPTTGKIVAITVAVKVNEDPNWVVTSFVGQDEQELLKIVDNLLIGCSINKLYTFNGKSFDVPFLIARSMKHNLGLHSRFLNLAPRTHTDLFHMFGKQGSLHQWALAITGTGKIGSGKDVASLAKAEDWKAIREYARFEMDLLAELVDRLECNQ